MKRMLCIVSCLNAGGAETFLMKLHSNINTEKYQMDFCVMSDEKGVYDDLVLSRGGRIFRVAQKSKNPIKCFLGIKRIVEENGYNYVMRVNEHSLSVLDLLAAKAGGAKVLIMRSSNASCSSRLNKVLHYLFRFLPKTVPNVKLAPSTEAAEYTFGKGCVKKGKAFLLHNGLDYDTYKFDSDARENLRAELGMESCNVIGHVGRFSQQKNHDFLIDVFNCVLKNNENCKLALVGVGELEDKIREKVCNYGIADKVIFLGRRSDVPKLMSAFDALVLPSFYEGMPNVIIEAQASGLACILSDTITPEADITGLVDYLSLGESPERWAEVVLEKLAEGRKNDTFADFRSKGYELSYVTKHFVDLVFKGASE